MNTRGFGRFFSFAIAASLVLTAVTGPALAKKDAKADPAPVESLATGTYPATVGSLIPNSQRFDMWEYADLVLGAGLADAPPEILFERMQAAAEAGENYKALYLARILTRIAPDSTQVWENRARLAASLNLIEEAGACQLNAQAGSHAQKPPPVVLPGAKDLVRPETLADWAAAMALLAEDVESREGAAALVAIKDNVSGMEIEESGAEGPFAVPSPIGLDAVLPNLFVLREAKPMSKKSVKLGSLLTGVLAGATNAYGMSQGAMASSQLSELSSDQMTRAFNVASSYKGGSYEMRTFEGGEARDEKAEPRTAGKEAAVETPLAVLWVSGGAPGLAFDAAWAGGKKMHATRIRPDDLALTEEEALKLYKKYPVPQLRLPKLAVLGDSADKGRSIPLALHELLLSEADLREIAGDAVAVQRPSITKFERAYETVGRLVFSPTNSPAGIVGFDDQGTAFQASHQPTRWIVAASR